MTSQETHLRPAPRVSAIALVAAVTATIGCSGNYKGATTPSSGSPSSGAGDSGPRGVAAAALPFKIVDARTGHEVAAEDFYGALAGARAVCLGEDHRNPHHHWAQLHLIGAVADRAAAASVVLGLGMEMFQRPFQGVLDDYAAGRIDEAAFLSRSGWNDRWGFDYALYRPMIDLAVSRGAALVALNTPRELTKKVSRQGLESLSGDERKALPELVLDDAQHRAWFEGLMAEMGGSEAHTGHGDGDSEPAADAKPDSGAPTAERIYTAQVLWDETMADTAARWLAAAPSRHILILAGNGHCHDSAIVRRMQRRGVAGVVSVRPIIDDGGNVATELASPDTDYLFVMSMPAGHGHGATAATK